MASKKAKDDRVYLSPSSLKSWYDAGCPRRWAYDREWRVKEPNMFMETGTETHKVMAGELDLEDAIWKNTPMFHGKFVSYLANSGLTLLDPPELEQQFEILPGVVWTRILDRLALTANGDYILLDYKTTGAGWKYLEDTLIVPQSLSTQSIGYLYLPPPSLDWPEKPLWPSRLWYLIASFRGPAKVVWYDYTKVDEENFFGLLLGAVSAIREARSSGWPKAYGRNCLDCPFNKMCYELEGYADFYEQKPGRNGKRPAYLS